MQMVIDWYLSTAIASSIVLASTVPSSGIILFTFSSSGESRWLFSVGKNFNLEYDKGGDMVEDIYSQVRASKHSLLFGFI